MEMSQLWSFLKRTWRSIPAAEAGVAEGNEAEIENENENETVTVTVIVIESETEIERRRRGEGCHKKEAGVEKGTETAAETVTETETETAAEIAAIRARGEAEGREIREIGQERDPDEAPSYIKEHQIFFTIIKQRLHITALSAPQTRR